ncbi:MAG: hypothetical protein KJN93_10100 [Alphaproteobacteria bacterium]|nr:hypothetical protein [Alphaproteobacteria bacterium]
MSTVLDLRKAGPQIEAFLVDGIGAFASDHRGTPVRQIGIYSCPWSGWVALCFDSTRQDSLSCPDMAYFEEAVLELPHWRTLYEDEDRFTVIGQNSSHGIYDVDETGDEGLNEPVFHLLCAMARGQGVQAAAAELGDGQVQIGVQMLDSAYEALWEI